MNIIIFSTDDFLHPAGGAERAIADITKRLQGISFDLICAKLRRGVPLTETIGNVTIHRIGVGIPIVDKLLLPILGCIKVWRLRRKKKIHVFWVMMVSFAGIAAYLHNLFCPNKRIPIVQTIQEGDSKDHIRYARGGLIHRGWSFALSSANRVTVISHYLEGLVRAYGFRGRIDFVPNGVDVEMFQRRNREEEERIKKKYNLSSFETVLVTTSRLEKKNAVGDIIKSLEHLQKNTALLILGDGSLRKELEVLAEKRDFSKNVFFLGYKKHEEIPPYLHVSDIFVRPSLSEGMGNSFLEAMAAGIPVIGTPVGGIVDFLKDGETGFLSRPGDPKELARAIEKVSSLSDEEREAITTRALREVEGTYEWSTVAEKMEEIFKEIGTM
ncbi:MAG: glycosyltransferase family 4 protein [Candidatus Paceibacterota bacterium]